MKPLAQTLVYAQDRQRWFVSSNESHRQSFTGAPNPVKRMAEAIEHAVPEQLLSDHANELSESCACGVADQEIECKADFAFVNIIGRLIPSAVSATAQEENKTKKTKTRPFFKNPPQKCG